MAGNRAMRILITAIFTLLPTLVVGASCPLAEGFDADSSDARAMAIADEVMDAMGGCEAWKSSQCLAWNFFGRRFHVWDKWTGDIRVESGERVTIMNLNSRQGRAWDGDHELTDKEALSTALELAYAQWINDSYWLFMPYKLKDSGVTLRYIGEGKTEEGAAADVLELTFHDVGLTPENKYRVYVDRQTHLVTQWDYYRDAADEAPAFTTPWTGWKRYGNILLSGGRGDRGISEIAVFQEAPPGTFESPAPLDLTGGHH